MYIITKRRWSATFYIRGGEGNTDHYDRPTQEDDLDEMPIRSICLPNGCQASVYVVFCAHSASTFILLSSLLCTCDLVMT